MLLSSCGYQTYDGFIIPEQGGSSLQPVAEFRRELEFDDIAPEEKTVRTFTSADGLCTIEKKEHYFDVTLDLENGSHYDCGAAYGEAIISAMPDYSSIMEPYIYENINMAFGSVNEKSFEALTERLNTIKASLDKEYIDELDGFADTVSGGVHGFSNDGILSYEEMLAAELVPDCLRGTACSAASLDGSRTVSGERITARILEWTTGSADQISQVHTVLHLKNGSRSLNIVSALGMLSVITAYNDDGVLAGILDVGCEDSDFVYEGRTSYTFALRYALENYDTAREAGEYMVKNSGRFTFCHNILLSDRNEVYCAEDSVCPEAGESHLRSEDSPCDDDFPMEAKGPFFIVNDYAYDCGERDEGTSEHNIVRWKKFNEWFSGDEKFSAGSFKSRLASEAPECYDRRLNIVRGNAQAFHIVIVDYGTGTVQASFYTPPADLTDHTFIPEYIRIDDI